MFSSSLKGQRFGMIQLLKVTWTHSKQRNIKLIIMHWGCDGIIVTAGLEKRKFICLLNAAAARHVQSKRNYSVCFYNWDNFLL